ncbi:MAG TPA: hypothetical protein VH329_00040 [Solirubrobacterales bacterium]
MREERPDIWPHTARLLPWLLAGFLTMLFLVPVADVTLNIPTPFDPTIDRFALSGVVCLWILVAWLGRPPPVRVEHPQLFLWATVTFVSIALLSLVMNAADVASHNLLDLAQNRLVLLFSFVLLGWFTVASMRPGELANFSVLLVVLASIMAVGIIWESRTGYNVFYSLIGHLFDPVASVASSPTDIHPELSDQSRSVILGPTEHGLAATTMLAMVFPFALVGFLDTRGDQRWLYALAAALILGAALATERKTAVVAPVAAGALIAAYRPRGAVRLIPLGLLMIVVIHLAAPGALGTISELKHPFSSSSSIDRTDDYVAVSPDFLARPLLGWGYGTRDIAQVDSVRILDNEYLDEVLTVGLIGTLAFVAMIVSAMVVADRAIRSGNPARAGPALAASAACLTFLVANALFDSMSFVQVPYLFFFAAGIAVVAASRELPAPARQAIPAPSAAPHRVQVDPA